MPRLRTTARDLSRGRRLELHDVVVLSRRWTGASKLRPISHQPPALFEQVPAAICSLGPIIDSMCERLFNNFAGIVRRFGRPITKCRTKTMYGESVPLHPT